MQRNIVYGMKRRTGAAVIAVALLASLSGAGPASASLVGNTTRPQSNSSQTLVVGITGPLTNLRPVGLQQTSMTYNKMMYEPLLLAGTNGTVLPNLAKSWSLSSDRKTITLTLQAGVSFTNGKPFTSADVLAMLNYALDPANAMDALLTLKGCKFTTPNARTVVIRMPIPEENALLNSLVSLPMVDTSSNLSTDPIGTGPYSVASFTPNVELNLARNPSYWNKSARAKIANVDLKVFEDAAPEVAAFEAGAIDVLTYPPLNQVARLRTSGYGITSSPGTGNEDILGNVTAKGSPFDKQQVREALSWAFDRDLFVKLEMGGLGVPTCDMWASTSPAFEKNLPDCGFNLAKAKAFLDAAGYRKGFTLQLYTMGTKWPELNDFLPIYQADLAKIGVKLAINTESPTAWGVTVGNIFAKAAPGITPAFYGWANVDAYFVADYQFFDLTNLSHFSSPAYDNLLKKAVALDEAGNGTAALRAYKALAVLAAAEAFDFVVATRPYVYAYAANVKGVSVDIDGMADWASASFR